jgi:hypothetical protein
MIFEGQSLGTQLSPEAVTLGSSQGKGHRLWNDPPLRVEFPDPDSATPSNCGEALKPNLLPLPETGSVAPAVMTPGGKTVGMLVTAMGNPQPSL